MGCFYQILPTLTTSVGVSGRVQAYIYTPTIMDFTLTQLVNVDTFLTDLKFLYHSPHFLQDLCEFSFVISYSKRMDSRKIVANLAGM